MMRWNRLGITAASILAACVAGWLLWPAPSPNVHPSNSRPGDSRLPASRPKDPRPEGSDPAPGLASKTATVAQLRLHVPADLSVIRLAEDPNIMILDFASLARQAHMLDRIAALIEKNDLPRDRILTVEELARAVQSTGDMSSGFYYGHDYSAGSLNRFFALADRTRISLTPDETLLRRLLAREGWFRPDLTAGLISLPRVGADATLTQAARDTILAHELSHGAYFSNPPYADYVHQFWLTSLTQRERDGFRGFLAQEGYDTANAEIVENETQAYLFFTTDPHFFDPSLAGLTPARRAELRAAFLRGIQVGWLRNLLTSLK